MNAAVEIVELDPKDPAMARVWAHWKERKHRPKSVATSSRPSLVAASAWQCCRVLR